MNIYISFITTGTSFLSKSNCLNHGHWLFQELIMLFFKHTITRTGEYQAYRPSREGGGRVPAKRI